MAPQTFVIRRKGTLDYFAGFAADGAPVFTTAIQAKPFGDRLIAEAQALLLRSDNVQIKPVAA